MTAPGLISVFAKYRLKLKGGDWNPDSGMTHAAVFGRTLCGVEVRGASHGWERQEVRYADESAVECRRCLRSLHGKSKG